MAKGIISYCVSQKSVIDLSKYCSHLFIVSVEISRQQRLLEDHLSMLLLKLQAILAIFKSFSILYQSHMNKGGINSDNQVLQMTLSL